MPDTLIHLDDVPVLLCAADGQQLQGERDAVDVIGEALSHGAGLVAIPTERLGDDFFRPRTRLAGELIQKFVNYRLRVAIVGDIGRHLAQSKALREFVYEANRGTQVWFVDTLEALEAKLKQADRGRDLEGGDSCSTC